MNPKFTTGTKNSRNRCQEFNGILYYEKKGQGYFQNKPTGEYLHRAVWIHHNGDIPAGYEIHHKDHNKANNRIENLEMLTATAHQELHSKTNTWNGSEENKQQLMLAQEKAKEWHSSPEGIEWHRKAGKESWIKRGSSELECLMCGDSFMTPWPTRAKFCTSNCKMNYRRWRLNGFAPELKPKKRK